MIKRDRKREIAMGIVQNKKAPLLWCFLVVGEANASISELPSIARSSSLVGTVTGSFLKLKVITSLCNLQRKYESKSYFYARLLISIDKQS